MSCWSGSARFERRFYQKITDLYALAVDYDCISPVSRDFFASIQNKLHWAITGKTAAETIHAAADASRPQMGLTTWKRAPHGKVLKSDVTVAKNYLSQVHLQQLNRLVSAYLDLAENRADRRQVTTMAEWARFMDRFLELSDYDILQDKGRISAEAARIKAHVEYNVFRVMQDQDYLSDFDREVQRIQGKEK